MFVGLEYVNLVPHIARALGKVIRADHQTHAVRTDPRFEINMDPSQGRPASIIVESPSGHNCIVFVEYEDVAIRCT